MRSRSRLTPVKAEPSSSHPIDTGEYKTQNFVFSFPQTLSAQDSLSVLPILVAVPAGAASPGPRTRKVGCYVDAGSGDTHAVVVRSVEPAGSCLRAAYMAIYLREVYVLYFKVS
ncbi:hypothetical protein EIP91_009874 [Steccherinum ochraceum]|uniref:Uncharacterized protein n=1 Tax=Steccherinum ochraceum TaxID=92696 RepID=A0A4V2MV72_9APHY|nr:hypothetical protein EIP91_009874 [Steccherinum ochraceum]